MEQDQWPVNNTLRSAVAGEVERITLIIYLNSHEGTSPTNNQPNINPHRSPVDEEVQPLLPIHPRGTIKAPASSHTTKGVASPLCMSQCRWEG